jgi:hypothetical protein
LLKQMRNAVAVVDTAPPDNAIYLITLFQEKLRQVGTVLACYPGDNNALRHMGLL